jgi:hypothetical protein
MSAIDYSAPADFYPARRAGPQAKLHYRRFDTVAEAIRHAVEEAPFAELHGALIECDEQRYQGDAISVLYNSADYPLPRQGQPRISDLAPLPKDPLGDQLCPSPRLISGKMHSPVLGFGVPGGMRHERPGR